MDTHEDQDGMRFLFTLQDKLTLKLARIDEKCLAAAMKPPRGRLRSWIASWRNWFSTACKQGI